MCVCVCGVPCKKARHLFMRFATFNAARCEEFDACVCVCVCVWLSALQEGPPPLYEICYTWCGGWFVCVCMCVYISVCVCVCVCVCVHV